MIKLHILLLFEVGQKARGLRSSLTSQEPLGADWQFRIDRFFGALFDTNQKPKGADWSLLTAPQAGSARIPRGKAGRLPDRAFASARADAPTRRGAGTAATIHNTDLPFLYLTVGDRIG